LKKTFSGGHPGVFLAESLKRRIHFSLICLAAALVLGQRALAGTPFIVDVWGTADGLPQSSVIAVTQTRDGYLWLGTLNGLVRFDGNSFTRFNVNNTPGLPGNGIVFLFEDRQQILWVGTETAGLCAIQNGVVKNFETGGAGGKVIYAYEDETGVIWFCTDDRRIFRWQAGRLDLNRPVSRIFREQLFYRAFHVIVPRPGGSWHLLNNRVEKWSDDKLEKNFGVCPWTNLVSAAVVDRDGNLVVATLGEGVYWFDGAGGYRHITTDETLSHNYVLSVCFDREGNLWGGTDGNGLYRVKKNFFTSSAGLDAGVAQSASEDSRGGLWSAFNLRGLAYCLTNSVQNFGIGGQSKAWSVLVDSRQQVWAGTRDEGLFRFVSGNFQKVAAAGNIGLQINALFQGRDGKLWVGSENGLGGYDGQAWKFYSTGDGLPPNAVRALADDAAGNLWIGTGGGGLFALRGGKISPVVAPVNDISCLLVDRDDALWVGTAGHGLARFSKGDWTRYSTTNGLASDDIGYFIKDDLGNLWIGSYEGLIRAAFTNTAAGTPKIVSCRTFLTRACSVGAQPAAIRTHDGRLWFPTNEGLVSVDPTELKPNQQLPPVVIESVTVDGVEQKTNRLSSAWTGAATLSPDNEQLDIHFTSLNFSAPKGAQLGVRFRYQLEGRDKNWTDAGTERVAHYTKLTPGKFIFRVIACNEDGVWNETGAAVPVTVEPPFWRTPWFIAAAILFFIGALAGTIYLISTAKLKRQLRALRQKELLEKERSRIARDLHDQLGANLTQVALLGELAEADKDLPGEVAQHAQQISAAARETTRSLDEIVWAVNPSNDTLESLANYACKYAQDYFALAGVRYRVELPVRLPTELIPPEVRHNVFLAFKEAVNNVVKHAHATEARVKLQLEPGKFVFSIADNGRGLGDVAEKKLRNGLKNMRRRLADVHGEFEISPGETGGTVVQLTVPIAGSQA
jgi:signal transduction histidine kinase/ligand-binding sensor domain-containing protein